MTRNFRMVLLQDAIPGMVLSDNLLDRHGKVLLPAETVLNEKMLESLRRYDIDMIPVFSHALTPEEKAAQILERQEKLAWLFRKGNYDNPAENANDLLFESIKRYRQEVSE